MKWNLKILCFGLFILGAYLFITGAIWQVACGLCLMIVSGCGLAE
jgi:hypothetical protein